MQSHIIKLLQIVYTHLEQYQMFKDESTVTRMLLKVDVDSLMSVIYKEYNDLTMEVRQKQSNKRKHNQLHTHLHYDYVDNVRLATGIITPYYMQPDFGGNLLRIVQDWAQTKTRLE